MFDQSNSKNIGTNKKSKKEKLTILPSLIIKLYFSQLCVFYFYFQ